MNHRFFAGISLLGQSRFIACTADVSAAQATESGVRIFFRNGESINTDTYDLDGFIDQVLCLNGEHVPGLKDE